ncbi:MAG: methionine synthase, partial [Anaerolineae bacterium]
MDLAKQLAKADLAEGLADEGFRVWRQTRTGLMSYPTQVGAARGHLGASAYLQMAMRPHIVHVVGYCEADHAARPGEVIESCQMARRAIEHALRGMPDMAADPAVQQRRSALRQEAMQIVEAIRALGSGARGDPLLDVEVLARAVEVGLLDAPHLRSNPLACGRVRTQAVDGAIVPLDEEGKPISEARRVARALASA